MLIEYTIEVECEPKRRFTRDGLADRLRVLARVLGSDSPTPQDAAAGKKAEFELRPQAYHCGRCPANFGGRAFGCYGVIQGPITEDSEDWLMELLPETLTPGRGDEPVPPEQIARVEELLRRLGAAGIDGSPVDQRRPGGDLLEGERPAERRYGGLFRRKRITSSQVLQFLLLRDSLAPADAELALRALGVWEDGGRGDDGLPEAVFTQPPDDDDDPSVADLKQFFHTLMVACSLDVPVRVTLRREEAVPQPIAAGAGEKEPQEAGSVPRE